LLNDFGITASNYVKPQDKVKEEEEEDAKKLVKDQTAILSGLNPEGFAQYGIAIGYDSDGNLTSNGAVRDTMYHLNGFSPVSPDSKYFNGFLYNGNFYTYNDFINNQDLVTR
jgi:hypothetical protein